MLAPEGARGALPPAPAVPPGESVDVLSAGPTMAGDLSSARPLARGLLPSFGYAWRGVARSAGQRNMRIHLALGLAAALLGLGLGLAPVEWAVLALTIGLVLAAEAFNTAIEQAVDLASPARHPLAGAAKDAAAGGVLIAAVAAVAVALALFGPRLLALVR